MLLSLLFLLLGFPFSDLKAATMPFREATDTPLFRAYPSLASRLKRFEILTEPTPFEPMRRLEQRLKAEGKLPAAAAGRLWVKRDDRSWSTLGGNKARKLEFLLADAASEKAHTLVTAGMWGSNHAYATAQAARELGLKARLILGPQPLTEEVRKKLLAFHALGAELVYHGNKLSMGIDLLGQMAAQWLKIRKGIYYVPPGGSNLVGSVGYVNAWFEVLEQLRGARPPSDIFLPLGTGGTAAGLLAGACLSGHWGQVRIHAERVVDPLLYNERKLRKDAAKLHRHLVSLMDADDRKRAPLCDFLGDERALVVDTTHAGPEYGAATEEVHRKIRLLRETEGLVIEPTYTGKSFADFLDQVGVERSSNEERPMLFWLTYNSHPIDAVITSYPWTDSSRPWRDLPRKFWRLFE
ncbi:MAG: pyridoxal-phosphate dependent enzyme [Bdellovibrionales bacterium]|nr:pyridoxal-phosphate dependent enzyme [Bdellovibrionales bacterium]